MFSNVNNWQYQQRAPPPPHPMSHDWNYHPQPPAIDE